MTFLLHLTVYKASTPTLIKIEFTEKKLTVGKIDGKDMRSGLELLNLDEGPAENDLKLPSILLLNTSD